jgi:hypothetical protein
MKDCQNPEIGAAYLGILDSLISVPKHADHNKRDLIIGFETWPTSKISDQGLDIDVGQATSNAMAMILHVHEYFQSNIELFQDVEMRLGGRGGTNLPIGKAIGAKEGIKK